MELKRFIHTTSDKWAGVNHADYNNSIVFIKDKDNASTGVAIYTQGATFNTDDVSAASLEQVLKNGSNITITSGTGADEGKLIISAPGISSIVSTSTTELVQAQAVKSAFSSVSSSLTYTPTTENANSYQFNQTFTSLGGTETTAPLVKITGKNGIGLDANANDGLIVKHTNSVTAVTETKVDKTLSVTDKTLTTKAYSYDAQGHVTGSVSNVITLPDSAFKGIVSTTDLGFAPQMVNGASAAAISSTTDTILTNNNGTATWMKLPANAYKNTTYDLSAESVTGGVNLNLTSDETNAVADSVKLIGSGDTTVSVAGNKGAEVITIKTNTYTSDADGAIVVGSADSNGNKEISLTIHKDENVLSQTTSGLKSTLGLNYNSTTNKVELTGIDDVVIDSFDASAFVKDSFLQSAEFVTLTDGEVAGKAAGDYIKFVFNTVDYDYDAEGKVISENISTTTEYVALSGLIDYGTITYNTSSKQLTSVNGVAKTSDVATAVNNFIASLDATEVTVGTANDEKEDTVKVVNTFAISETDGIISASGTEVEVAKTSYVDNAIAALDSYIVTDESTDKVPTSGITDGTGVTANDSKFLSKIVITNGKLDGAKSEQLNIADAKLVSFAKTSTETNPYVAIDSTTTIVDAIEALQAAWDWGTI